MSKFTHTDSDPWSWSRPTHPDVPAIVELSDRVDVVDIQGLLTKNPTRLHYFLHKAIVDIGYGVGPVMISVAKDRITDQVLAWSYLERGKYMTYADEEMAFAENCTVDTALSTRTRVRLTAQIIEQWIAFCELKHIPVLVSNTFRHNQTGYLHLHEQYGFEMRGSVGYRRCDV